jgi:tripartite-type tricarboxylate transporter receptor subunit TctC
LLRRPQRQRQQLYSLLYNPGGPCEGVGAARIGWFAILAPVGTPREIIARLNAEVLKAVGDREIRRKLEELGFAVRGSSAEELRIMTRDSLAKYARVIKGLGIARE